MKTTALFAACLSLFAASGCSKPEDDDLPPLPPAVNEKIAFEGKVDPALVGTWATADHRSTMTLSADGKSRIKSMIPTPGGAHDADNPGQWKTGDGTLLVQNDGGDAIRFYTTMKGKDTMEVRRVKGSKIVITYQRQTK